MVACSNADLAMPIYGIILPHLDGTDSQEKAEIGKTWADMAGTHFKYFMVFKKAGDGVPGAMLLNDFLGTLAQL